MTLQAVIKMKKGSLRLNFMAMRVKKIRWPLSVSSEKVNVNIPACYILS